MLGRKEKSNINFFKKHNKIREINQKESERRKNKKISIEDKTKKTKLIITKQREKILPTSRGK